MQNINDEEHKGVTYAKITLEKRIQLVQLVIRSKISVARAARKLEIKVSTAKLIIKKFREEGTFFESIKDRMERLSSQNAENEFRNSQNPLFSVGAGTTQTMPSFTQNYFCPLEYPYFSYCTSNYQPQFFPCPLYFPLTYNSLL